MDWDVKFDNISVKDKIKSLRLSKQRDSFCWEVDIELIDVSLYQQIDWAQIPSAPRLEVLVDGGSGWASQGKFYIERPTYSVNINERGLKGIWGRSGVAVLAEPFAKTITKTWVQTTSLYSIIDEVVAGTGVVFNRSKTSIPDFLIDPLAYSADKQLPIDIINDLAELCGAIVLSDSSGGIFLQKINYNPIANDLILNDIDIEEYSEEIVFPEFANRVRIVADESSSGHDIEIMAPMQCIMVGGATVVPIYARVSDDNGQGIDNVPVDWQTQNALVALRDGPVTNTGTIIISSEQQNASGFYTLEAKFPPSAVISIYWAQDHQRETNLINWGYTIDGKTITINKKLDYCDETLIVTYACSGVAVNHYSSGPIWGDDIITASVAGATAKQDISIGNPCKCSSYNDDDDPNNNDDLEPRLGVKILADPEKICAGVVTGHSIDPVYCPCPSPGCVSSLLVSAEDNGPVTDGRSVKMLEITKGGALGELEWFTKRLGNIKAQEVPGTIVTAPDRGSCVATTGHYWMQISRVEWKDPNDVLTPGGKWTVIFPTAIDGKAITFAQNHFTPFAIGTEIRVTGTIYGAAINHFLGKKEGTAEIEASVQFLMEEPIKETCNVEVIAPGGGGGDGSNPNWPGKKDAVPTTPDGKSTDKNTWAPKNLVKCIQSDGTMVSCLPGNTCCQKDGAYGCNKPDTCQGKEADEGCQPANCQDNPTSDCLGSRFNSDGQTALNGCTCSKLCEREFGKYGTTQDNDNSSYRTIDKIVTDDFQFVKGDPIYEAKYDELYWAAMEECRRRCGDCGTSDPVLISGSGTVLSNSGTQFSASGGTPPYSWGVGTGPGRSGGGGREIDASGLLTLTNACGAFVVTVADKCGKSAKMNVLVGDSGFWGGVEPGGPCEIDSGGKGGCFCYSSGGCDCFTGPCHYGTYFNLYCMGQIDTCGIPNPCGCVPPGYPEKFTYAVNILHQWVC